jgi:hypothetical protein
MTRRNRQLLEGALHADLTAADNTLLHHMQRAWKIWQPLPLRAVRMSWKGSKRTPAAHLASRSARRSRPKVDIPHPVT